MLNFAKLPIVVGALLLYGYVPLVSGTVSTNNHPAGALVDSLPALMTAEDYFGAASTALQLAAAHDRAGDKAAACAALRQSLAQYRKALAKESGISETAVATVDDDSDGMADVRARFGCARV